jgi:hypothetical protein
MFRRNATHRAATPRDASLRNSTLRNVTTHETRPPQTPPFHALGRRGAMLALPWLVAGGYGVFQGTQGRTDFFMVQGVHR